MHKENIIIGVYKYKFCNIASLVNALEIISVDYKVSENFLDLNNCSKIILPGVGNMKHFSNDLIKKLSRDIKKYLNNGGMIYGICLGMQLLLKKNEESGLKSIGLINGAGIKLEKKYDVSLNVGFSKLLINNSIKKNLIIKKLFKSILFLKFYHLHKFFCQIKKDKDSLLINSKLKNKNLTSFFFKNNILGTQFHPELSGKEGLIFLKNFCQL
jgi:glutamine amidotransferase|tara:strand:- start:472 stop:1110 length:639 start_codon:yes stop_codon:yes gene_type:complete